MQFGFHSPQICGTYSELQHTGFIESAGIPYLEYGSGSGKDKTSDYYWLGLSSFSALFNTVGWMTRRASYLWVLYRNRQKIR